MSKQSPSVLNTRMGRISRRAYAILLARARARGSSMADELDKVLDLEKQDHQEPLFVNVPLAPGGMVRPMVSSGTRVVPLVRIGKESTNGRP